MIEPRVDAAYTGDSARGRMRRHGEIQKRVFLRRHGRSEGKVFMPNRYDQAGKSWLVRHSNMLVKCFPTRAQAAQAAYQPEHPE